MNRRTFVDCGTDGNVLAYIDIAGEGEKYFTDYTCSVLRKIF